MLGARIRSPFLAAMRATGSLPPGQGPESEPSKLQHQLAEMLAASQRFQSVCGLVESKAARDRNPRSTVGEHPAKVCQHSRVDGPDLLDAACAERHPDELEATQCVQVEVECRCGTAQAADVDKAPFQCGRSHALVEGGSAHVV